MFSKDSKYATEIDGLILQEIESKSKLPDALDLNLLKVQLKELLKTVPKYTLKLRNLEDCLNTLNIHARNYQLKLRRLQGQVSDNLDFLGRFAERESETFKLQIQADLNYSKPGSQLLDQAIASIRGLVEIDQAESDQDLENTIQAVGTGIGVGIGFAGILAAGYPLIEQPWDFPSPQHPLLPPHPFVVAVVFSCFFGCGLGWLAWFWTKRHLQAKSLPAQEAISPSRES